MATDDPDHVAAPIASEPGLRTETMMHPLDGFIGRTLKKGEWIYNQAITPYPSWAWTNRLGQSCGELHQ